MSSLVRGLPILAACLVTGGPAFAQAPLRPLPAASRTASVDLPVDRRIAELRARLKITPSEEGPFTEFTQVMRENAERTNALVLKHRDAAAKETAVEQMQGYGEIAQAHVEDTQRLIPAFSRLYAALSPEQQHLADDSFRAFSTGQARRGR